MRIPMQNKKKQVVPGELGPPLPAALYSRIPYLLQLGMGAALGIGATLGIAAAGCSSASQSEAKTESMRPCPQYNNHMPVSLKTPCIEIDGKYYRTD